MPITENRLEKQPDIFWDRPLGAAIPISREIAFYVGLFTLAAILRFWDLGARAIHHDESLHSTYSYFLYIGKGYVHDPMMHGPWQFTVMALSYFLFGASEITARLPHAIFGSVLSILPFFIRRYMGRSGAAFAGLFLALSPSFLYFSRFAREDAFVITWTMLIVVALIRYLHERAAIDLYVLAGALSLGFATKESTYITCGIFLPFLVLHSVIRHKGELLTVLCEKPNLSPQGDLVVLISTLIAPLFTGFLLVPLRVLGVGSSGVDVTLVAALAVIVAVSTVLGLRWNWDRWLRSGVLFWGLFVILFTTFFSNPAGLHSGSLGALKYWIVQQGVGRGGQPWYYYLVVLGLREFVILTFGLAGVVYWARSRDVTATFLVWWVIGSQSIYAYTSEKMPWTVVNLALPLALLGGMTIGRLLDRIEWRDLTRRGAPFFGLSLVLVFAGLLALPGVPLASGQPLPTIAAQNELFHWIARVAVLLTVGGLSVRYGRHLGWVGSFQTATVTLLLLLMAFSIHIGVLAAYDRNDSPGEIMSYTQTSADVRKVMDEIERVTYRTGATKETFKVAYDEGVAWPFEWYLRDYTSRNFFGTGTPAPDAPIVLTGLVGSSEDRVVRFLGSRYVGQRYRLRTWLDESSYRAIGSHPGILWTALKDPTTRVRILRFLIYREPLKPSGSTDFMVYVRRDLAQGTWIAPQATGQTADEDAFAAKTRIHPSLSVFGSRGSGPGQFNEPKGIAVGPDGSLFVTDGANHRVTKFDPNGRFVRSWGSHGQGDGQFNEPWGIAVDARGAVFVADTWNHRIQIFDSDGKFTGKIGGPDLLFGPRALAFTQDGRVLVADTGHHRVVVYDRKGTQVGQFGSRENGEDSFYEPVGIAVDRSGNVYVADTWNHRVRKFDPQFVPVARWPIAGWNSESRDNKPYLALDRDGRVHVTDPEGGRVISLDGSGKPRAVWGRTGDESVSLGLPIGLAIDGSDNIFVVDSQKCRVVKFAPVR